VGFLAPPKPSVRRHRPDTVRCSPGDPRPETISSSFRSATTAPDAAALHVVLPSRVRSAARVVLRPRFSLLVRSSAPSSRSREEGGAPAAQVKSGTLASERGAGDEAAWLRHGEADSRRRVKPRARARPTAGRGRRLATRLAAGDADRGPAFSAARPKLHTGPVRVAQWLRPRPCSISPRPPSARHASDIVRCRLRVRSAISSTGSTRPRADQGERPRRQRYRRKASISRRRPSSTPCLRARRRNFRLSRAPPIPGTLSGPLGLASTSSRLRGGEAPPRREFQPEGHFIATPVRHAPVTGTYARGSARDTRSARSPPMKLPLTWSVQLRSRGAARAVAHTPRGSSRTTAQAGAERLFRPRRKRRHPRSTRPA